jgi:hypothetical protein
MCDKYFQCKMLDHKHKKLWLVVKKISQSILKQEDAK